MKMADIYFFDSGDYNVITKGKISKPLLRSKTCIENYHGGVGLVARSSRTRDSLSSAVRTTCAVPDSRQLAASRLLINISADRCHH